MNSSSNCVVISFYAVPDAKNLNRDNCWWVIHVMINSFQLVPKQSKS